MSSARGVSLRTRLLVPQIAVTALFLLIMGVVSTKLFAVYLNSQFKATIQAESIRNPTDITQRPTAGTSAVVVTFSPFAVRRLTTERSVAAVTDALTLAIKKMSPTSVYALGRHDRIFDVPAAGPVNYQLQAAARLIPSTESLTRQPSVVIVAEQASGLTRQLRNLILAEIITGGCLVALLAAGGRRLIGRGLEPIDRMARTANDITAGGDLAERMTVADDQTEVGRLGAAINTMLDRIQQAFGARLNSERKVREFAADASHELRTPLTTIRGYAELYRQGALGPEQLPGAMRRIEQEAQRMSTLVAELLELARLDRTSSLDLTETDLSTIVRDAVADAMAVEPDRLISAQAPPRLVAVVDERRIRQVMANLLGNVRAHTPASASVAVRLGPVQGGVLIEVADSGPGMAPEDEARAFDRFHRAAEHGRGGANGSNGSASAGNGGGSSGNGSSGNGSSGNGSSGNGSAGNGSSSGSGEVREEAAAPGSGGGGSGLGLSIVQAIANAHGGQATLESWLGHGTRVRIWLPTRTGAAPPADSVPRSPVPGWRTRGQVVSGS
jgi:signal transduction histidine kinase